MREMTTKNEEIRVREFNEEFGRGYEEICTGCGEVICLSQEEHDQWDHGFDEFMCWECE